MAITLDSIRAANSSIEIQNAAGQPLTIDGSGFITSNINGTVTVSATQLDIDDLSSASDNVEIQTAAGQALAIDGSGFLTISNTTFAVTATQLDIDDLEFGTDSVTAHQGGSWSFTLDNTSTWETTAEAPTATVSELVAVPLASRNSMTIQNIGTRDVYVGPDNTVTASGATQGLLIPKGSSMDMSFDSTANVFAITASGTAALVVAEYAA